MWNWSESHLSNGWWDSNEFNWNIRVNSIFELRASSGISFQGWFKQWSWVATVVPNQANLNHASEQFTYHQYHAKKHKKLHFWPQKLPPTMRELSNFQIVWGCIDCQWMNDTGVGCCVAAMDYSHLTLICLRTTFEINLNLPALPWASPQLKSPRCILREVSPQFCNFAILQSCNLMRSRCAFQKNLQFCKFIQLSDSSVAELQNANHGWETYTSGIKSSKKYLLMCR